MSVRRRMASVSKPEGRPLGPRSGRRSTMGGVRLALVASVAALLAVMVPPAGAGGFHGSISRLTPAMKERMRGVSWHAGCPVPLRKLRVLHVTRWGFDRKPHGGGTLIVHQDSARGIRHVMRVLFEKHYPIRRMRPVDAYGGSDRRSMNANN